MFKFWNDMFMLGIECQQVIWLRSMKLATGGAAGEREARRMVTEKVTAAAEAGIGMAMGKSPSTVVGGYRKKVRANRRRLSR